MGSTHQLPERERYLWRREELLDRLAMTLGAGPPRTLVFGTATSGAEDDLEKATKLARTMVLRWGMSPGLGLFASGAREEQVFLGRRSPARGTTARRRPGKWIRRYAESWERPTIEPGRRWRPIGRPWTV
jgi:ATP-dependent Zn protease